MITSPQLRTGIIRARWNSTAGFLGPKADEFRKFMNLPALAGEELEIVINISPDDPDIDELKAHRWRLASPDRVRLPEMYRDFIAGSAAEFSCAKGGYTGTRCGWFSDRSECFLAAGRPVVLQSTGFEDLLPTGKGLFSVRTVDPRDPSRLSGALGGGKGFGARAF